MHIEEQRWAPTAAACLPAPLAGPEPKGVGFGQSTQGPFLPFDFASPYFMCFLATSCTEFASYPEASLVTFVTFRNKPHWDLDAGISTVFGGPGKAGRILSMDYIPGNFDGLQVTMVPNYGPAGRKWWWSGTKRATAAQLADVINGKSWGAFKHDNVKKRIVAFERSKVDGKFWFALNESKPGDAWWWGYGASVANITSVVNGEAWANFPKDKIQKRLVLLKRHAKDNWTFLMVPRNGLGWYWYPKILLADLVSKAKKNNNRVISLQPWSLSGDYDRSDPFSAVLVRNE